MLEVVKLRQCEQFGYERLVDALSRACRKLLSRLQIGVGAMLDGTFQGAAHMAGAVEVSDGDIATTEVPKTGSAGVGSIFSGLSETAGAPPWGTSIEGGAGRSGASPQSWARVAAERSVGTGTAPAGMDPVSSRAPLIRRAETRARLCYGRR